MLLPNVATPLWVIWRCPRGGKAGCTLQTQKCVKNVCTANSLFSNVFGQKTAANQYCTSTLESVANSPVAVQANCAPCLALSESVCQRPHGGFGLMLRTPAKLSSVKSCIMQGLFTAHLGCLAIPISCLVVATDCIKTHQRSEGTPGSRRRQEATAEVQLRYFKHAYSQNAYDTTLQQDQVRVSRGDKTTKTATCTFVLAGELRFASVQDAHATF